jgi:hypothetical protein
MDVRLPDGTILKNVPDGTTKAQLTEKLAANGYDISMLGGAPAAEAAPVEQVNPRRQMVQAELRSAAAPFAGFSKGVSNVMFGGQRLAGKGLEAIGATETGQTLQQDAARRQAEQEAFIAPYREVAPAMTGAGEFTGEVVSTLPVGGVIAKGVSKIPGAGRVAEAIRTGGFSTGAPVATTLGGRAADIATRATGGAVVGGTSAALLNDEEAATGAAIGAVAPLVLPTVGRYIAQGGGKIIDAFTGKLAEVKAGKVAREMTGDAINQIRAANKLAPIDVNAAQAAAGIDNDVYQAFLDFYAGKDKSSYFRVLKDTQKAGQLNRLAQLAGGPNLTENIESIKQGKNVLNQLMTPIREAELNAANIAGTTGRQLQSEADRLAAAATGKVGDVRRFAGQQITKPTNVTPGGLIEETIVTPGAQGRAVSPAAGNLASDQQLMKLAAKADEVAAQAAEGSLAFGEAARFKQAAVDSLADYGLKPLKSDSILSKLGSILRNREFAGNDVIEGAVKGFGDDVVKWTNNGGVIDAFALDSLRKNSVNAAIDRIRPNLDQTSKKNLAAKVIAELKAPIVNAIEEAGGTGYGQYLRDYAANAQLIDRRKLAGKALEMFNRSPDEFTRLVQGNNPDAVETVFGPGSFNIFKEMGADIKPMQQIADELTRDLNIKGQVKSGRLALGLEDQFGNPSELIPGFVGYKTAIAKKVAQILTGKVNDKAQRLLSEGARSGKSMNEILNTFPAEERVKALKVFKNNPELQRLLTPSAVSIGTPPANALAPEQQNQNALRR